jgi:hypothetical protein
VGLYHVVQPVSTANPAAASARAGLVAAALAAMSAMTVTGRPLGTTREHPAPPAVRAGGGHRPHGLRKQRVSRSRSALLPAS